MSNLHLSVLHWLEKLELTFYFSIFQSYHGVEDMLHLSEGDLKTMGIRNGSHRARMASSLTVLKEKYNRAQRNDVLHGSNLSLHVDNFPSRSHGSLSPMQRLQMENVPPGNRSWPSSRNLTRHSSHRSSMEGVIGFDATPDELKKALEWELSLDRTDLRSHGWYHGTILRQRAEDLITKEEDFLVRDCISQPGDFVITCRWKGLPLHFIIKKTISQLNTIYEKIQFCFEGDTFDSIHDFITYYVGGKCPLSVVCSAIISNPINRSMPLSYYTLRYGVQCQVHYAAKVLEQVPPAPSQFNELTKIVVPIVEGEPLSQNVIDEVSVRHKLIRVGSDPSFNPNIERKSFENRPNSGTFPTEAGKEIFLNIEKQKPPPKPSRVPSKKGGPKPLVVKKSRRNTPPTPYFDVPSDIESPDVGDKPSMAIPYRRLTSGETRFSFLDHASVSSEGSLADVDTFQVPFTLPKQYAGSCFRPSEFQSSLLPNVDNKPLEAAILNEVKQLLLNESSKQLASHLTRIDLEISKNFKDEDLGLGVTSGLELILLPQGQQLVQDLLERTSCFKTFIAVTILTCSSEEERIQILGKWIQIAIDVKNSFGNLYGFTGIMLALTHPQIANLHRTWLELRRLETDMTFTFETKLRPTFKAMQEALHQVPPNACIPYMLSLLNILQHQFDVMKTIEKVPSSLSPDEPISFEDLNFGLSLEENSDDFGLQVLEDHLEASRNVLQQWPVFQNNTDMSLRKVKFDDTLLDIFRTEFHLRMLWGRKGAVVESEERHRKFQKVLDVLFKRYRQCSAV